MRWRPRAWPPPPSEWTDVAAGSLGDPTPSGEAAPAPEPLSAPPASPPDDVVWLPPVPAAAEPDRLALARALAAAGSPVLLQVAVASPGGGDPEHAPERIAGLADAGATVLLDPVAALLAGGLDAALAALAGAAEAIPGAAAVWPLIAGVDDGAPEQARAAEALAAAGFAAVQPLALGLSPAQRRRLAETGGAASFDALFHRPPPDERAFARAAAAAGLAPFLPRPLPRPPLGSGETRRLAGLLALAGELWLRCGRPPESGQALIGAARWADQAGYDLGALAREGNLGVIPALDERSRALLAEAAAGGEPALLRELLAEYAGGAGVETRAPTGEKAGEEEVER